VPDRDDKNWAGKGFGKRNEESAPLPKPLAVSPPKPQPEPDEDDWIFE
jgi:hypothetical protein